MSDDSDDDTPPRGRRPRSHWGDDERAAAGRGRRTPAHGVPVRTEDRSEFTPVTDILDSIEDPTLRRLFRLMWEHTANQELRNRKRVDDTDSSKVLVRLDAHEEECLRFKIDLVGANGDDGRIGEIRKAVEAADKRASWMFRFALGAIGGVALALVLGGRWIGTLETKVNEQQERTQLLESATFLKRYMPGPIPEKDIKP